MRLYLLERNDEYIEFDQYSSFLIRAKSQRKARLMAQNKDSEDRTNIWLDKTKTKCTIVTALGDEEIVISEFASR